MIFTDYLFVPAFLLVALVYYLIPLSKQWVVLLIISLMFYASWGFWGFIYLIGATVVAWGAALWISHLHGQEAANQKRKRTQIILLACILILIGVLAAVKIRSFAPESLFAKLLPEGLYRHALWKASNEWFNGIAALQSFFQDFAQRFPAPEVGTILAPLGISYFTLSLVGYVVDVYWEIDEAEKNPFRLLLFAAYFPKILEGPISRHRLTAQQLNEGHSFEYRRFCFGLQRMLWGYCEKLVIADRIAILTGTVLDNYTEYHGSVLLVTMVLYAFELYCDFNGCMDIALGVSEALGITLEENFDRPFFSQTGAEFWRRWHISLGTWFKDYVFMPIGHSVAIQRLSVKIRNGVSSIGVREGEKVDKIILTKRKRRGKRAAKTVVTVIQTSAVWLLIGLWHATGWNYVIWGVYWGILLNCSSILEPEFGRMFDFLHISRESKGWKIFRQIRTFFIFMISLIISTPTTLQETVVIFDKILFHFRPWELFDGTLLSLGLGWPNLILMIVMLIVLIQIELQQEKGVVIRDRIAALPLIPRWCIYLGGIYFVLIFGVYGAGYDAASFVYMGF